MSYCVDFYKLFGHEKIKASNKKSKKNGHGPISSYLNITCMYSVKRWQVLERKGEFLQSYLSLKIYQGKRGIFDQIYAYPVT